MRFQKGQSGNPAGRPRGSRNKASLRVQALLEQKTDELVDRAIQLAMDGNIGALRLCLDRLAPTRHNEPQFCEIPPLAKPADAVAAIGAIAAAAFTGDVTADEAAKLAKVTSLFVHAFAAQKFDARITGVERAESAAQAPGNDDASPSKNERNG